MGQALPKRRTVLIVEDYAELRSLTAALLEDEQLDTIECESAEAALVVMLMGGARHHDDLRRRAAARSNGRHRSRVGGEAALAASSHDFHVGGDARKRPRAPGAGVAYIPKPWQPLNVLALRRNALLP